MSKHSTVPLPDDQRGRLEKRIRSGAAPARIQTRDRALLLTERSQPQQRTDRQIADAVWCSEGTVVTTRERLAAAGREAAPCDKPRPGAKPEITGQVQAELPTPVCRDVPGMNRVLAQ